MFWNVGNIGEDLKVVLMFQGSYGLDVTQIVVHLCERTVWNNKVASVIPQENWDLVNLLWTLETQFMQQTSRCGSIYRKKNCMCFTNCLLL